MHESVCVCVCLWGQASFFAASSLVACCFSLFAPTPSLSSSLPFSAAQLNSPAPSQRRSRTAELRELERKVAEAKNVTPQQVRRWKESVSTLKQKLTVAMARKAKSGRSRELLKSVLRNYRNKDSRASL